MTAQISFFRRPTTTTSTTIPTPHSYSPGKAYLRVDVDDDSLQWVAVNEGAALIFEKGTFIDGHVHAVEIGGELTVAVLYRSQKGYLRFIPWQPQRFYEGCYKEEAVKVLGHMHSCYPTGIPGPSWGFNQEAVQYAGSDCSLPILRAVAN